MSADMASKINAAVLKAAAVPAVREKLATAGFEPSMHLTPAELSQAVKVEFDRNAAIVKQFEIKTQ
jgi:tripartite-type tricarboxylate transporter receptor subunit TctC